MKKPLVTVICLCYNQSRFVVETLNSVIDQDYSNIEMIIVDDGSDDGSKGAIVNWLQSHPGIPFIDLAENIGNTVAFNKGLDQAEGKYVIDLACDDVLLNDRVEKQVQFFESLSPKVGVIYGDVQYITEEGQEQHIHFSNKKYQAIEGDVYAKLIDTYFIPPPSMMMKKEALEELGGYDESLAYEDFDFWVRSARHWEYAFQNEVLTQVRVVKGSHSTTVYQRRDRKLVSTLEVCEKILLMNKSEIENAALLRRLKYEIRQAFIRGKKVEVEGFFDLYKKIEPLPFMYIVLKALAPFGMRFK